MEAALTAFSVTRAKDNMKYEVVAEHESDFLDCSKLFRTVVK